MAERTIFQIQIALRHSKPKIWRRVLVEADTPMPHFHAVVQLVMGWRDSHLHQFVKDGRYFAGAPFGLDFHDDLDAESYKDMVLSEFLSKEKEKMLYEYDFGDAWEHDIILEKILPADPNKKYPACVKGVKACPPEDCGGIWGYYELLEALKDPKHREHRSMREWLEDMGEEDFDPDAFHLGEVNKMLQGLSK